MYILTICALTMLIALAGRYLSGDPLGERRGPIRVDVRRGKGFTLVRAAIAVPAGLDFELREETSLDRWGKALGLVREQQLPNPVLDRDFFLEADEPALRDALASRPQLLEQMARLSRGWLHRFDFMRLVCREGSLWLTLHGIGDEPSRREEEVLDQCARRLVSLAQALPPPVAGSRRHPDWARTRARWLRAFLYALVAVAVFALVHEELDPISGAAPDIKVILLGACAILAALLSLTVALLFRSSRVHSLLLEVLLIGSVAAVGSSYLGARTLNESFDTGPPQRQDCVILSRQVSSSRSIRHRHYSYYLGLAPEGVGVAVYSLQVSAATYFRSWEGEHVVLVFHKGLLGTDWMEMKARPGER